ncbi:MAG: hypothetical protein KF914_10925 [Rhizobiaceae bacterium]|nr:hypothetical protein [Rhizobiaceae bacterium]
MFANAIFLLAIIGGPVLLGGAVAFVLRRQSKLSVADRAMLLDTADTDYVDQEEDGCPVRVDQERRRKAA